MRIVNAQTGAAIKTVPDLQEVAVLAYLSSNATYAAGQIGSVIDIWESAGGKKVASLPMSVTNDVQSADFDPAENRIALRQTNSKIVLFDLKKSKQIWSIDLNEPILSLAFHRQGRYLLAGAESGTLFIIDAESGKTELTIAVGFPIGAISFTPDGKRVILFHLAGGYKILGRKRGE